MRKVFIVAAIVAVMAVVAPSHAAVQVIVATPGGAMTGLYDGPNSVAVTSAPVVFINADPLGNHNVVSDRKKVPSCTSNCAPLFKSGDPVGAGGVQQMSLVGIPAGDYGFHCSIHSNMKGTLTIAA